MALMAPAIHTGPEPTDSEPDATKDALPRTGERQYASFEQRHEEMLLT
jgi:hypothetical protein